MSVAFFEGADADADDAGDSFVFFTRLAKGPSPFPMMRVVCMWDGMGSDGREGSKQVGCWRREWDGKGKEWEERVHVG